MVGDLRWWQMVGQRPDVARNEHAWNCTVELLPKNTKNLKKNKETSNPADGGSTDWVVATQLPIGRTLRIAKVLSHSIC